MPPQVFELPDLMTSSALTGFEFSPGARERAADVVSCGPDAIFHRLVRDQESEENLLVARQVTHGFLARAGKGQLDDAATDADADGIAEQVRALRDELAHQVESLTRLEPDAGTSVLGQRAPISLTGGCWLDVVSQPATQPSVIVNHLFRQHVLLKGAGNIQRSSYHLRRRALEEHGVFLPEIGAGEFLRRARARPLTSLHACFYVALSRLPASFLPEVVGVHYAFYAIGVDDLLSGTRPLLDESAVREVLAEYLALTRRSLDGPAERRRLHAAIRLSYGWRPSTWPC